MTQYGQSTMRRPFPVPALDAWQVLNAANRSISDRLWRAACAERMALEDHTMGLLGVALQFLQDAVDIMKGHE